MQIPLYKSQQERQERNTSQIILLTTTPCSVLVPEPKTPNNSIPVCVCVILNINTVILNTKKLPTNSLYNSMHSAWVCADRRNTHIHTHTLTRSFHPSAYQLTSFTKTKLPFANKWYFIPNFFFFTCIYFMF